MWFGTRRSVCSGLGIGVLLFVVIGLGPVPRSHSAEKYAEMDVPPIFFSDKLEDKQKKRELELLVQGIITGAPGALPISDEKAKRYVDSWYRRYYFPVLTHQKELANWVDRRERFLKLLMQSNVTANVQAHDFVVNVAFEVASAIVKGNYHPAARTNAMLLIGRLNAEEWQLVGENRKLPVPLMISLRTMLEEFEDPKQIDGVRAACLVGIQRHVEIDRELKPEQRRLVGNNAETRLINVMSAVINQKEPPKGRTREGHVWIRRQAVDILAHLGSVGQGGKVVALLETLLADDQEAVPVRCSAAEALGRLNYPKNAAYNAKDLAKKVGAVAIVATLDEIRRADELQQREAKQRQADSPYGSGGPGYGPGGPGYGPEGMMPGGFAPGGMPGTQAFDPLGYRLDLLRRVVKSRLVSVKTGLAGPFDPKSTNAPPRPPAPQAKDAPPPPEPKLFGILSLAKQKDDKDYVAKVIDGVDKIIGVTDSTSAKDMLSLTAAIRTNVTDLENGCEIVVKKPGAAAELSPTDRAKLLADPDAAEPVTPPVAPAKVDPKAAPGKPAGTPAPAPPPAGKTPPAATSPPAGGTPPAGKTPPPSKTPPPGKTPPAAPAAKP